MKYNNQVLVLIFFTFLLYTTNKLKVFKKYCVNY